MFSTQSDNCTPFVFIFDIIVSFAAELEKPETGTSGKRLTHYQMTKFQTGPSGNKLHATFWSALICAM